MSLIHNLFQCIILSLFLIHTYRFEDKAKYREHCRNFHKNGHECSICHRLFSRRALLRRHQSVHTGLKDFHCDLCCYASSHKSNLERHLKTHQSPRRPRNIKMESQSQSQPPPDSTTATHNPELPFPPPRALLGSSTKSKGMAKIKTKLSHSIESILSRRDPVPNINKHKNEACASASASSVVTVRSPAISSTTRDLVPATCSNNTSKEPEVPIITLPEVNWSKSNGTLSSENVSNSNPTTFINHSVTPDLNLSQAEPRNNGLPSSCLQIPSPAQDLRFHTDYLSGSNLFSPYYHYQDYLQFQYQLNSRNYSTHHPFLYYSNHEEVLQPGPLVLSQYSSFSFPSI